MAFADIWPVLLLAAVVAILAGWAWTRLAARPRAGEHHTIPVDVPPPEVELEDGPVWACLECGSLAVGGGSVSMGMLPGAGDGFAYVCHNCHHRGPALEFDSPTAYRLFVQGLHSDEENENEAAEGVSR